MHLIPTVLKIAALGVAQHEELRVQDVVHRGELL